MGFQSYDPNMTLLCSPRGYCVPWNFLRWHPPIVWLLILKVEYVSLSSLAFLLDHFSALLPTKPQFSRVPKGILTTPVFPTAHVIASGIVLFFFYTYIYLPNLSVCGSVHMHILVCICVGVLKAGAPPPFITARLVPWVLGSNSSPHDCEASAPNQRNLSSSTVPPIEVSPPSALEPSLLVLSKTWLLELSFLPH